MKTKIPVIKDEEASCWQFVGVAVTAFLIMALLGYAIDSSIAHAEVVTGAEVRFNNDNIHTSVQPAPIGDTYDFGALTIIPLEDGKTLLVDRYILEPEYGISIFRYQIDEAYWFVTSKGVIWGENTLGFEPMAGTSLQALSVYLTL